MKNGIEYRANGNRIVKREGFGYDVHILREDGGYRSSCSNPWDYLNNARADANQQTPLHVVVKSLRNHLPIREDLSDSIRNINKATNILTHKLKEVYMPLMKMCETKKELSNLMSDIRMSLGMECGEDFPGTFLVDIVFEYQRFYVEVKNEGADKTKS
jgi:hypothetical protein